MACLDESMLCLSLVFVYGANLSSSFERSKLSRFVIKLSYLSNSFSTIWNLSSTETVPKFWSFISSPVVLYNLDECGSFGTTVRVTFVVNSFPSTDTVVWKASLLIVQVYLILYWPGFSAWAKV